MQHFDLIIVGGGLAGASLALALRDTRLRIALVEHQAPRRPEGWDSRVYAISPANVMFLESIGAWRHLDPARIAPIRSMEIFGDGSGRLSFSAFEAGVPALGSVLESSLMACEFWESAKRQANLTLFCPARSTGLDVTSEQAILRLDDGSVLSARLIVGADGRDSWVRESAGLVAQHFPYNEMGVVANFVAERPHGGTAYQWFRPDGVLAYLPLPDNQVSMVWSAPDALASELSALPEAAFCARVAGAGANQLGRLRQITAPAAFPLRLMKVPETVASRIALIGDAAHGIHPLSGHGINLGFQDAQVLSALLAQVQPWQDLGGLRLLKRYQRARREETVLMQSTTDGLRRLFRDEGASVGALRNAGLSLTNRLPFVKNVLVRYALGAV